MTTEILHEYEEILLQFYSMAVAKYVVGVLIKAPNTDKITPHFSWSLITADPDDNILEAILAKHYGKPLFIDFWATWCVPCIQAKRTMQPLKAEMKERGVVAIYITDESSSKTKWRTMLPDIGGIHYFLTQEQMSALRAKYQIQGFPTYMIFDKAGEKTFQTAGFPGNDRMRAELVRVW